jgi:hypothetical protein
MSDEIPVITAGEGDFIEVCGVPCPVRERIPDGRWQRTNNFLATDPQLTDHELAVLVGEGVLDWFALAPRYSLFCTVVNHAEFRKVLLARESAALLFQQHFFKRSSGRREFEKSVLDSALTDLKGSFK